MNKGRGRATGEIVGILNSDDFYANESVLSKVASLISDQSLDAVYGDVAYFEEKNPQKIVRRYRSHHFSPEKISWGWMPAHPSLFVKKNIYDQYGLYKTDYDIAADFEFIARIFYQTNLKSLYVDDVFVNMQVGGVSTGGLRNSILLNQEVLRACRENQINTNLFKILSKYPRKIREMLYRP